VAANAGSDLYATVDEADEHTLELLDSNGFTVARRKSNLLIPTDPSITGLDASAEPAGVVVMSAADAYEDELRRLDEALRQGVPGTAGWRWDPGDFHEETFDSQFDPATYLIAVDAGWPACCSRGRSGCFMSAAGRRSPPRWTTRTRRRVRCWSAWRARGHPPGHSQWPGRPLGHSLRHPGGGTRTAAGLAAGWQPGRARRLMLRDRRRPQDMTQPRVRPDP
jgi:hypothetical protein